MLNKIARLVGAFCITLVVLLLMLFIVLTAMEYRPESTEKVRIDSLAEDTFGSPEVGSTIKVMRWKSGDYRFCRAGAGKHAGNHR